MALVILPQLMSSEAPFMCRKNDWPENTYIFGCPRREIPNKEIPNILLFEDHVRCFLDGQDMFIDRTIWHLSIHEDDEGKKRHLIKQWIPSHDDLITAEWEVFDYSEVMVEFKEKLNEQTTEKLC